jgi:transposase-like protein
MSKAVRYSSSEKQRILNLHLKDKKTISEIAREEKVTPATFYSWQTKALDNLSKCFDESDDKERRRLEKRVKSLEKEVVAKKEVIADLAEEAINVKKKLHRP